MRRFLRNKTGGGPCGAALWERVSSRNPRSLLAASKRQPTASAFTLVELLVATAVLVLLVAMVGQLFNSATSATTGSRKQLDADNQARMVFDRMALDFAKMVKRKDVDSIMCKSGTTGNPQNDKMFFFSEAPAYSGSGIANNKSSTALVGYRINSNYQLERLGTTLGWDGTVNQSREEDFPGGIIFISGTAGRIADTWQTTIGRFSDTPTPFSSGVSKDYHVLSDSVYRMEICFQVKDLANPSAPGAAYSNYPVAAYNYASAGTSGSNQSLSQNSVPTSGIVGDRWFDTQNFRAFVCTAVDPTTNQPIWSPNGLDDVLGIVVTIALLDESSRQPVVDPTTNAIKTGVAQGMVKAFFDPKESDLNPSSTSISPILPAQTWQGALLDPNFKTSTTLPQASASQVRIYQRFFSFKTK